MSAILKTTVTRPNLSEHFWFESIIKYTNNDADAEIYTTSLGTGFVATQLENIPTWSEIETRQSELPADVASTLLSYKDQGISLSPPIVQVHSIGPNNEPPYNPFSLTFVWNHEWDTLEHLNEGYAAFWAIGGAGLVEYYQSLITSTNNTVVEEVYVDGTKVSFSGLF